MADKPWKVHERETARRLGGTRSGPTGRQGPDVVGLPVFAPECKSRKRPLPGEIREALAQARRNAGPGQLSLVVWHTQGERHDDDVVMLRLADFTLWFGDVQSPREGSDAPRPTEEENK